MSVVVDQFNLFLNTLTVQCLENVLDLMNRLELSLKNFVENPDSEMICQIENDATQLFISMSKHQNICLYIADKNNRTLNSDITAESEIKNFGIYQYVVSGRRKIPFYVKKHTVSENDYLSSLMKLTPNLKSLDQYLVSLHALKDHYLCIKNYLESLIKVK